MRAFWILLLCVGVFITLHAAEVATGRVHKVLNFLVDREGHIAKSPSLFERDAYQAWLRAHTNEIRGVRYDVLWSASGAGTNLLKLRLELRGITTNTYPTIKTYEKEVKPGWFRKWAEFPLTKEDYDQFKAVTAWRATLWDGDRQMDEQKSFLW